MSGFGFRVVAEISPTIGSGIVAATSAANYQPQNLAPASLGSLFGANLATDTNAAASLPLPTTLAGSSVFIKELLGNEHLANLLYASPSQINFQLPANLPTGAAIWPMSTRALARPMLKCCCMQVSKDFMRA